MAEYTFVSEVTKAVLPFGVTKSTQVTRDEATVYLAKILDIAPKKFSEWGKMFVKSRTESWTCWTAGTIQRMINELGADIDCLVSLLYVTPPTQEHQDDNQ